MLLSVRSVALLALPLALLARARNVPEVAAIHRDDGAERTHQVELVSSESRQASFESDRKPKNQETVFESDLKPKDHEAVYESDPKPKDHEGVFKGGHGAVATVRSNTSLASNPVDLANQDAAVKHYLRKRQDSNATISADATSSVSAIFTDISTTTELASKSSSTQKTVELSTTSQGQSSTSSAAATSPTQLSTVVKTSADIGSASSIITVPASSSTIEGQTTPATSTSFQSETTVRSSHKEGSLSFTAVTVTTTQSATTSDETRQSTTKPAPSPSTQTGILVPVVTSTTADDGSVMVTTTTVFDTTVQTSIVVDQTTTDERGQTIVTSTLAPATSVVASSTEIVTATDDEGETVVVSRPRSGGTYTTTKSGGRVATVTYQPGGGVVSQIRVQTTVLPNGHRSTITSFAEIGSETGAAVGAQPTDDSGDGEPPRLQSGAGLISGYCAAGIALVAGAVLGGTLVW